jgi:long-chain acyl-CoA synthetase
LSWWLIFNQPDRRAETSNPMAMESKPWTKSYKLGPYPLEPSIAPYPELPVYSVLDQAAEKYPGQTAVIFEERALKFAQLRNLVDRLAAALAKLGIARGDRVCLFLPNCIEYILCDWAVLKCGAVVVPTSILRTYEGLLHEVSLSGSKAIICQERYLEQVLAVCQQCNVELIIITSNEGYDAPISASLPSGVIEFHQLLRQRDEAPPSIEIDPRRDLGMLVFTGGATGTPKGVMLSHYNLLCSILQGLPWMMKPMLPGLVGKASAMLAIPLFHVYGHYVMQSSVYLGLRCILLPDPRDTQALMEAILKFRPLLIPGVPTQFMRLAEAGLNRLNVLLLSGSAPLPQEVAQAIKKRTGLSVSQGYGLTETSSITHMNLSAFSRITGFMPVEKVGIGIPVPDTDCRLLDVESGQEVPAGEPGEIVVRGPQVMMGYWPEPGSGLTPDGWLYTGDIGVRDEDGYFQVIDRIKDMVNVSGMKVYTTSVDEVLFKHPGVLMAAAFGVPDLEKPGSERVMAVIRLKEDYSQLVTCEEIQDFCRIHLPPYAIPRYVEFREDLPLTVTEKVFKKALRDEMIARLKMMEVKT